jgi:hypothetical protein
MKKGLIFAMLALSVILMTSCFRGTRASVDVTVKNKLGLTQSNVEVCMFKADTWSDFSHTPQNADKTSVTDLEGVATFELTTLDIMETVFDGKNTVYFVVFDREDNILGQVPQSVKMGQHYHVTLNYDR